MFFVVVCVCVCTCVGVVLLLTITISITTVIQTHLQIQNTGEHRCLSFNIWCSFFSFHALFSILLFEFFLRSGALCRTFFFFFLTCCLSLLLSSFFFPYYGVAQLFFFFFFKFLFFYFLVEILIIHLTFSLSHLKQQSPKIDFPQF